MVGKTWGLGPKASNWIYTQVVRPGILYASAVWWKKVDQSTAKAKLTKVQRLACLSTIGAMKTTPTAAMEILLRLDPLPVAIKEEAMKQALKLHEENKFKEGNLIGHLEILRATPLLGMAAVSDQMPTKMVSDHKYNVRLPSREDWSGGTNCAQKISQKWYTDGSKMESGVGAGVVGPRFKRHVSLGSDATIFQAEVHAIHLAVGHMITKNRRRQNISIMSDSQAALNALRSTSFRSKMLYECHQLLNQLAEKNKVELVWVPGHEGIEGNEKADQQAKLGAIKPFVGPSPMFGFGQRDFQMAITKWATREINKTWNALPGLKHSKKFLSPNKKREKEILNLNRRELRLLCGILTGHIQCRHHLMKMGLVDDETCRYCGEEAEHMEHIIMQCPALCLKRLKHLECIFISEEEVLKLPTRGLIDFVKDIDLS